MTNSTLPHMSNDDVIIYGMPIEQGIDWWIRPAYRHSQEVQSPESWLARRCYLEKFPTDLVAFKSMDGRINSGTRFLRTIGQR